METVHRPGKDHVNGDGLSRIPDPLVQCKYYSYGCDVQDLPCGGCKYCVWANEQWDMFHDEVDDIVPLAVRYISQDESDTEPHEDSTSTDCVVWCGLLSEGRPTNRLRWQSRWRGTGGSRTLQRIILEHCHDKHSAGHMGMNKTTERVKRYPIWYKMLDSCLVYVRSCSVCNRQGMAIRSTVNRQTGFTPNFLMLG